MKKVIHLICNAHLDPVWLWDWEEGVAETISTFRTAVEMCEQNMTFVFNHNEAILYEWILEYDGSLFERIRKQVKKKRWHIMGGWYLQPDCTMLSGESFVRQILSGRELFQKHFGVRPTTAINFDPFGHTRGLVQILAKSGYDSYLFGRPSQDRLSLDNDFFEWIGFDGSQVCAKRFSGGYNTQLGQARKQVTERIERSDDSVAEILWGVGNHGGGPSKKDLADIEMLIKQRKDITIRHSTPEAYFALARKNNVPISRREEDLNPWAIGCYTSMVRVKQKHRLLENELYMVEKMSSAACANKLMDYPQAELSSASKDLMYAQFHDILPGSAVASVEESALRCMDHGLEILSRIKARAFFALASGQKKCQSGRIPILIYNPHPHKIEDVFECEFNLSDINYSDTFTEIKVCRNNKPIPSQIEKEKSNIPLEWRKRVVFRATLKPNQMNRFDCVLKTLKGKPPVLKSAKNNKIVFKNDQLKVVINTRTGLVDQYQVDGRDVLGRGAFCPVIIEDNEDPWEMQKVRFGKVIGKFKLLDKAAGAKFSGVEKSQFDSVKVIEDGDVRTVVEAVFGFEQSFICQQYILPKFGTEIGVETRVFWNQKSRLLKLHIPMSSVGCSYWGQTAFGTQQLPSNGNEAVSLKWVAVVDEEGDQCFTCINEGCYGSDFSGRDLRLTLLRSPIYSGHPIEDKQILMQNRFTPRIDLGERLFRFWFNAGSPKERFRQIGQEAMVKNEKPFTLSFFPSGKGTVPKPLAVLNKGTVEITAVKKAQDNNGWIFRLFNTARKKQSAQLKLPVFDVQQKLSFGPFEVKTLRINSKKEITEVNLIEEEM